VSGSRDPLEAWRGSFGADYMKRNAASEETFREIARAYGRILDTGGITRELGSVLEVGANIGLKLAGLRRLLGPLVRLSALEPNPAACATLREAKELGLAEVLESDAYKIPAPDDSYDLVFTNGVLIHVPPDRLPTVMREICRVSRKYVLCTEYFARTPTEIVYRGEAGMLWKRDFGRTYLETCPQLRPMNYGFLWEHEFAHFDDLNWWLFTK
jgi:pseudaminic acid biosynthesis-associated methylase